MKTCLRCKREKAKINFNAKFRCWRFPDGLEKVCITCEKNRYANERIKNRLRSFFYLSIMKDGESKKAFMLDFVGCNKEFFRQYINGLFKEGMTWNNWGEWHLDHKTPCAAFDLTDIVW